MDNINNFKNLVELENPFSDIEFSEQDHIYKIKGDPVKYSVTKLIHKYQKPFPEEILAKNTAKKEGVSVQDVLDKWNFAKDYANHRGTEFHLYVENFLARKRYKINQKNILNFFKDRPEFLKPNSIEEYYIHFAKMVKGFLEFYEWYKKEYHLIKSEFVIGDIKTKLVGTLDNLSYNKKENYLSIFDYKTNKKIDKSNKYGEKFLYPLNHLDVCEYNKYGIQVWLYKLILERNTPYKIGDSYILWFSSNGYEKIKVPDFRKETELLLEIEEKNIDL
jgi:ATP-dependent exoDNAse (exonuclease V) beta subunit